MSLSRCRRHFGFEADLAHTYLYLLGYNAPEHALIKEGATDMDFWAAYLEMTDRLRPRIIEPHAARTASEVLPMPARAKIANMAPEDGATMGFFGVNEERVAHLNGTVRTHGYEGLMFPPEQSSK